MKFKVTPNSCRTCLQKPKKLRSIFKPMEEGEEPPHEMLKIIAGIVVNETADTEKLPVYLCKDCILSLNMAYEFRAKALKSQLIIETYFNLQKLSTEDEEVEIDKVEMCDAAFSDEEKIDYLQVQFDAIYNSIDDDPMNESMEEEEINTEAADDVDVLETEYASIVKMESHQEINKVTNSEEFIEIYKETDKETDNPKATGRRGRKRIYDIGPPKDAEKCKPDAESIQKDVVPKEKIDNGVGYICDICGNIYTKRFRMLEHRQGHDLELRHTCELCGKKFHLRERLRKHMYAHKDKKPHKCSYCSRTFFFESLKRSHEAVHMGSKPHVCEVCNKAFAYSQALKNHQLIHAEIKYHHCDYCDKDFRLLHHLKQHEETKLHQNAVKAAEKVNDVY